MSEFQKAMQVATSGMIAQNIRVRVISQNIANAESLATSPGGKPYQRQTVSFKSVMDRASGVEVVEVGKIGVDRTEFGRQFNPGHPAADANGYVQLPNVKPLIEMVDLRQAQRSYEANLRVVDVARTMVARTLDLLR
ncbi:MAG: flagellar basal body rod protein FlgC [Alphaproteobacteria bacterium]|nr:flagellar basal body rod protein FlgC [Alphaproteobacteria bacterium]MCZ6590750.1 flagellar basal body rod protein FlgC [Alphaproteobacteria bacterium]MCZ6839751.1 flagellar basal body rod protein FlgC [Alphaproteobacteria bacterium]